jgi:hypothetical protein
MGASPIGFSAVESHIENVLPTVEIPQQQEEEVFPDEPIEPFADDEFWLEPDQLQTGFVVGVGHQYIIKQVVEGLDLFFFHHFDSMTDVYVWKNNDTDQWEVVNWNLYNNL